MSDAIFMFYFRWNEMEFHGELPYLVIDSTELVWLGCLFY